MTPRRGHFAFVFVITFGRSGSTLLQGLLNSLPGYCIRGENTNALFRLFQASGAAGYAAHWGEAKTPQHPWYGALSLDSERFSREITRSFIETVLAPPSGTSVLGFKEIRHTPQDMDDAAFTAYLDFVEARFPGTGFIFNVRDPAAAARSGFMRGPDPEGRTRRLADTRRRLERQRLQRENSTLFDYDAFIADADYARHLFTFLGEPYDPVLVRRTLAIRHSLA